MGPGDVFVANDPYAAGGHLPDYNVFAPLYDDSGELVLIQAIRCHQGDTGGKDPGGFSPDAIDLNAEGLIIPVLKLVHRGSRAATCWPCSPGTTGCQSSPLTSGR